MVDVRLTYLRGRRDSGWLMDAVPEAGFGNDARVVMDYAGEGPDKKTRPESGVSALIPGMKP